MSVNRVAPWSSIIKALHEDTLLHTNSFCRQIPDQCLFSLASWSLPGWEQMRALKSNKDFFKQNDKILQCTSLHKWSHLPLHNPQSPSVWRPLIMVHPGIEGLSTEAKAYWPSVWDEWLTEHCWSPAVCNGIHPGPPPGPEQLRCCTW